MMWSGKTAIVTGGGSGIGKSLCIVLAERGCKVTVVDVNYQAAESTAVEIRKLGGCADAAQCDVRDDHAQQAIFAAHVQRHGGLDAAVLNAGIFEKEDFMDSEGSNWQATLDINLRSALVGTRLAAQAMTKQKSKGSILLMASAGGLFPMPIAPVYAASKAGLVHFTRSMAPKLATRGIRLCALCPQPVDTPMVSTMMSMGLPLPETGSSLLTPSRVVEASLVLLEDPEAFGRVIMVHVNGRLYEWSPQFRANLRQIRPAASPGNPAVASSTGRDSALVQWATAAIPTHRSKIQVQRLSTDFRAATRIVSEPLPAAANLPPGHVLVRRAYAGVNASDVNYTAGRYFGGGAAAEARLPFDAGFEAVGVVAAVGPGVTGLKVGSVVAEMAYGAFSEWGTLSAKHALPVPVLAPEVIALLTSGLTASIGLEQAGRMRSGETVLVTAAAGGTGQFAVQLAKAAGNTVVATCGSDAKAELLRRLGADRVINYRKESLKEVVRREYPKGVDLIWESVGGDMFTTCTRALAQNGRLVVIGMMSQYADGWAPSKMAPGLPELLLWRSASVAGFFLLHYASHYKTHLQRLVSAWQAGKLHVAMDPTTFKGLEAVAEAQDRLQSGDSYGKVYVQLAPHLPEQDSTAAVSKL